MKRIIVSFIAILIICVVKVNAEDKKVPDYNTPETGFVAADWGVLASEFRESLEGKYVYLDGVYYGKEQSSDSLKEFNNSMVKLAKNSKNEKYDTSNKLLFATFKIGDNKGKIATVGYPYAQREDGIQLIKLNNMDKIRVYGYIPPRSKKGGYLRDGSYREKYIQKTSGGEDNCFPAFQDYGQCEKNFIWMIKVVAQSRMK